MIDAIVRAARDAGAECLDGGEWLEREGYFYTPTVLSNVGQDSLAAVKESSGRC